MTSFYVTIERNGRIYYLTSRPEEPKRVWSTSKHDAIMIFTTQPSMVLSRYLNHIPTVEMRPIRSNSRPGMLSFYPKSNILRT